MAFYALLAAAPSSAITLVPLQFTFCLARAELLKSTFGPSVVWSLPATQPQETSTHAHLSCRILLPVAQRCHIPGPRELLHTRSGLHGSLVLASHVIGVAEILQSYPSLTPLFPPMSVCPASISGFGLPYYPSPIFFHFLSKILFPLIV